MSSSISLKMETIHSKLGTSTPAPSAQDTKVTRVRSKSFENKDVTPPSPKLTRAHSLSDLDALSATSKKCTHVLLTAPTSKTAKVEEGKSYDKGIYHDRFKGEYKSNPSLWGFSHCTVKEGNFYRCFITPTEAIKSRKEKTRLSDYHRGLQLEEIAAKRTAASYQEIGLPKKKIHPLGQKTFYLYDYKSGLKIRKVIDLSHSETVLLEDCDHIKFSSRKELFRFFSHTLHQLDALHKADICHMDIKPANICKTKNNSFQIIDLNDCLDFSDEKTANRLQTGDVTMSTVMTLPSLKAKLSGQANLQEAQALAISCDLFATGSTFYQMAHAFSKGLSLVDCKQKSKTDHYPHQFINRCPSQLKEDSELQKMLNIFNPQQR